MTALTDMLAALERGDKLIPIVGVDPALWDTLGKANTGNTQAAIDFAEAVLPEFAWSIDRMGQAIVWDAGVEGDAISFSATVPDNPARALLIATVKAMVAKEAGE